MSAEANHHLAPNTGAPDEDEERDTRLVGRTADPALLISNETLRQFRLDLIDRTDFPPKARAYLISLAANGAKKMLACAMAGVSNNAPIGWRRDIKEFSEWEQRAMSVWVEVFESEADRRALVGVIKPVFGTVGRPETVTRRTRRGDEVEVEVVHRYTDVVGYTTEFSDRLLEFRLRALDPEKYADRKKTELSGPGGSSIAIEAVRNELAEKFARQREARNAQSTASSPADASTTESESGEAKA